MYGNGWFCIWFDFWRKEPGGVFKLYFSDGALETLGLTAIKAFHDMSYLLVFWDMFCIFDIFKVLFQQRFILHDLIFVACFQMHHSWSAFSHHSWSLIHFSSKNDKHSLVPASQVYGNVQPGYVGTCSLKLVNSAAVSLYKLSLSGVVAMVTLQRCLLM